jgi:hypothetical protein
MKGVTAATALATAALAVAYRFFPSDWVLSAAITTVTTFYHFAMRLVVGAVVPRCIHNPMNRRWFRLKDFEPRLYDMLRVKQWKDHMPTYDPASFSLRHNSLEQIVHNSCVSEAVHEVIILFSFLPILFTFFWGALPVFLITSVLSAAFDSCFVMMQRYNRPRLLRILAKKEAQNL